MKTIYLTLLFLCIFLFSNAQNVNIPDDSFLSALIQNGVDTNHDEVIQVSEAESVTTLYINNPSFLKRRSK
jgi:hypothetical protein